MLKVTTKTKKEDLITAAMERNLVASREEAEKLTTKELYDMVKAFDNRKFGVNNTQTVNEESAKVSGGKKKLPPRKNKAEKVATEQAAEVVETKKAEPDVAEEVAVIPKSDDVVETETPKETEPEKVVEEKSENESGETNATPIEENGSDVSEESSVDEEEEELKNHIIAVIDSLTTELEVSRKELDEVKAENKKLTNNISRAQKKNDDIYNEFVTMMNKVANTKDEHLVWVWKLLSDFSRRLQHSDNSPIVLDIEKLIIEQNIRLREEQELAEKLAREKEKALKEDSMYEGKNISYIDGGAMKPDGVKKKVFKEYLVWYEDCYSWITYILEQLKEFDKIINLKKRNKSVKDLKAEVETWYDEWTETCDETVTEMVTDIVNTFFEDRLVDKALSNLVALIDELEL